MEMELEKDYFECNVCFQENRRAKKLPCSHHFCVKCMEKLIQVSEEDFRCPMCRTKISEEELDFLEILYWGQQQCDVCRKNVSVDKILWNPLQVKLQCGNCCKSGEDVFPWESRQAIKDCCRFIAQAEKSPPMPLVSLADVLSREYSVSFQHKMTSTGEISPESIRKYIEVAKRVLKFTMDNQDFQHLWNCFDPTQHPTPRPKDEVTESVATGQTLEHTSIGQLVNPAGYPIKMGGDRKFYCGRYLGRRVLFSNGTCGNGYQCQDCKAFRPLNAVGAFLERKDKDEKWHCNSVDSGTPCSTGDSFQCLHCLAFEKDPATAMVQGLSYRLKKGLFLTNKSLRPVEFVEECLLRKAFCNAAKETKLYGVQRCEKEGPHCIPCHSVVVFLNSAGYPVSNGTDEGFETRFYCGRYLNPRALPRTDGFCGPNNGKECADCQEFRENPSASFSKGLQNLLFQIQHDNPLVNRAGIPVTLGYGAGDSLFYCGRNLGTSVIPDTDGRCGPNNGNQCPDCKAFAPRNSLGLRVKANKEIHRPGSFLICGRKFSQKHICEGKYRCPECVDMIRNPGTEMRKNPRHKLNRVRRGHVTSSSMTNP